MEEFFYLCCQTDEVKIVDLILRRYGSLECMKVLSFEQFLKLLLLALEEERKQSFREEWLALIPTMVITGHYMKFEEYYDTVTLKNVDMRPTEVIMAEIDEAHEKVKEKKNGT